MGDIALADSERMFDPYMLPGYLRLNSAIEAFTEDWVREDPSIFSSHGANLRYTVERQLFFALFADAKLHQYFVATQTAAPLPDTDEMTIWGRLIAPHVSGSDPVHPKRLGLLGHALRHMHRMRGSATIRTEACEAPKVLFVTIHRKFVTYLKPIAERFAGSYAFLTLDDPDMFAALAELGQPRIAINLTSDAVRMTGASVRVFPFAPQYTPGVFEAWIIRCNAVKQALARLRPDVVVVPEGNAPVYELVNQACKELRIPTLCVQQGWAPVVHPGFRNMSYDRMCVWGDGFSEMLRPYNPNQKFVSTGNHCIQCEPQGDVSRRRSIAFFLQNGAHWMSAQASRAMFDVARWTAIAFPDLEIRVRNHPGTPLSDEEVAILSGVPNLRLMVPGTVALEDVLKGCRVAVAMNSTTILEAVAGGCVPLILDVNGWGPYFPNIAADGAAVEVRSFEAAKVALHKLVHESEYCSSFGPRMELVRSRLFAEYGAKALDAIVAQIEMLRLSTPSA